MEVEKFFEEQKGITVDAARIFHAKYTAIDLCRFAKKFHEAQIKQQLDLTTANNIVDWLNDLNQLERSSNLKNDIDKLKEYIELILLKELSYLQK